MLTRHLPSPQPSLGQHRRDVEPRNAVGPVCICRARGVRMRVKKIAAHPIPNTKKSTPKNNADPTSAIIDMPKIQADKG